MDILKQAFYATSIKRNTSGLITEFRDILHVMENDETMMKIWENYRNNSFFVGDLSWQEVMGSVKMLAENVL